MAYPDTGTAPSSKGLAFLKDLQLQLTSLASKASFQPYLSQHSPTDSTAEPHTQDLALGASELEIWERNLNPGDFNPHQDITRKRQALSLHFLITQRPALIPATEKQLPEESREELQ